MFLSDPTTRPDRVLQLGDEAAFSPQTPTSVEIQRALDAPIESAELIFNRTNRVRVNESLVLPDDGALTMYNNLRIWRVECVVAWRSGIAASIVCTTPTTQASVARGKQHTYLRLCALRQCITMTMRGIESHPPVGGNIPFEIRVDDPCNPRSVRHLTDLF